MIRLTSNESSRFKKIFVVIVTYNATPWIEKCLGSIEKSTIPLLPVIIDNNSKDGTVEFIKQNFPENRIIENNSNHGFGKANNIGFKYAIEQMADYILLLNQDAWIEPDTVEKLIEVHGSNPQFGIISPVHLNGKGSELDRNFSTYLPYATISDVNKIAQRGTTCIETNFVNAAAWLLSRDCILKIGGFDPLFVHYGEDRDYCYRAGYHDFKIGVALNTTICHDRVYMERNQYRKAANLLFSIGLAHLKNPNNSLLYNFGSWIHQRSRKILKWLLFVDITSFYCEILILGKLLFMMNKIIKSRKHCKSIGISFLR